MGRAHEVRAASMAKTAAMKSKLYAKYGKEIFMAAKSGVPDPNTNLTLRKVVEKARKENVPADVIKRAIDKAKGGSDENYTEMRYEGFGPGNVLVIVDCMTDNNNRTYTDVRTAFNKCGGKLGVTFEGNIAQGTYNLTKYDDLRFDAYRSMAEAYKAKGEYQLVKDAIEHIPEIYFTKLGVAAQLLEGEEMYEAAQKQKNLSAEDLIDMLIVAGKHLKKIGEIEKANSQFRIALKVMDAFEEDFIENKWFKATVYEYTNEQRKEIKKLLAE